MRRRHSANAISTASCVVALLFFSRAALGQPAVAAPTAPNQPRVPLLKLVKDPGIRSGQAVAVKGTVDGEGLRFTVGGLSILQPVIVSLLAKTTADDLRLTLFKKDWKQPRRTGSTGAAGSVELDFRTEGGVNVLVQSAGPPRPFYLVAWAGDEFHPRMRDVIVTPAEFKGAPAASARAAAAGTASAPGASAGAAATQAGEGGASARLAWTVAGGLGLVVAALAFIVLRRRGGNNG